MTSKIFSIPSGVALPPMVKPTPAPGVIIPHTSNTLTRPYYRLNMCYLNAYLNKTFWYTDRKLKMVVGSFGIHGWFEFGGKFWDTSDWIESYAKYGTNSHCWLEDEHGNIYDYLHPGDGSWVRIRTGKKMPRTGILEGVSKDELRSQGIEYVPAAMKDQALLIKREAKALRDKAAFFMNASCFATDL